MKKLILALLIVGSSVLAAAPLPSAAVMSFGSLNWSFEIRHSQGQTFCLVTVIRKEVVQSQNVWPDSLCQKRWIELEKTVARIRNPMASTATRCAQQMALITPSSSKKGAPVKKKDICWDFAGRAAEAEFALWWKKVSR